MTYRDNDDRDDRDYENAVARDIDGEDDPFWYGWYESWTPATFPGDQPEHIDGQLSLEDDHA